MGIRKKPTIDVFKSDGFSVDALENAVDLELEDPKVSHHNKLKKVHEDESIIKSIGGCREEHVIVRVYGIFVNFKTFKCLLRHNAYVNGDVSTLYMAKSMIYLENTLIVGLLQRDEDSIIERVMKYVAHDLIIFYFGALGVRDITDNKWPNPQVSSWHVVEQFYHRMQIDGVSCGLFLLNFMEYWTGEKLSNTFTQSDMTNFRLKLAAILCGSTLNTAKELPDDGITDDYTFDTTDFCQLIISISTISISIIDLCLSYSWYVKEWVWSSDPYPISLSLKNLQDILDVNRSMDVDVFNQAVRMLACYMATMLREPNNHFMDLTFSYICGYRRHPHNRVKHDPKLLWSFISECRLVVVPYYACGRFSMFAFDKHASMIAIIDPSPVHHNPAYNHPSYYYLPRIQKIARTYNRAMDEIDSSWNDDIYDWNHIYPCLTGFLVIELMNILLRKWLLIEVLKCNFNESAYNIPEDVRVANCIIRATDVKKYI
uniref:Ubiquitin-like protease family profile domain-containing protein n=1 Tax=Setaria viridis TaxID=4556 RepID=A0A4U6V2W5_SETVI|nr:hypothetical protein SEVIR_4G135600v2 [Setaria viridis]